MNIDQLARTTASRLDRYIDQHPGRAMVYFVITLLSLAASIIGGCAYFEARSFERITGKHVSVFDAVFIELRVQEPAQGEHP